MSETIEETAARIGLQTAWEDFEGRTHTVTPSNLRRILEAVGSGPDIGPAPLVATTLGTAQWVPYGKLILEDGSDGGTVARDRPWRANVVGYHTLHHDRGTTTIAVAPPKCWSLADAAPDRPLFGLGVQIYALRGDGAFGDFAALNDFAAESGRHGADALMLSPAHALFTAKPGTYYPYSPSSRIALNILFAGAPGSTAEKQDELIAWETAGPAKLARLRAAYGNAATDSIDGGDKALLNHARFEALDCRFRAEGINHWRDWPGGFADIANAQALDRDDPEIAFQLFAQHRARRDLAAAQEKAREAGMAIGLIADLAVGVDPAGSDAWSRPGEMLQGLTIGAPPDALGPDGQNWGLTTFSPDGLRRSGYAGFLHMLRAAMRDAGGVRIDHAMGLMRLWVIPEGGSAADGAYLAYPLADLLRLIALESHRNRAIVIGEDLGTVLPAFRTAMQSVGITGMRVLWFERSADGAFANPRDWPEESVALTTTHDLPTSAGWWKGTDIAWRAKLSGTPDTQARQQREHDKHALTEASGTPIEDADSFADFIVAHVASAGSRLAIIPLEDIFGLDEQPNLPGTIDTHPNWRRRLPAEASLGSPRPKLRLKAIKAARSSR